VPGTPILSGARNGKTATISPGNRSGPGHKPRAAPFSHGYGLAGVDSLLVPRGPGVAPGIGEYRERVTRRTFFVGLSIEETRLSVITYFRSLPI